MISKQKQLLIEFVFKTTKNRMRVIGSETNNISGIKACLLTFEKSNWIKMDLLKSFISKFIPETYVINYDNIDEDIIKLIIDNDIPNAEIEKFLFENT